MKKYLQNTRFTCLPDCVNCCQLTGGFVYLNNTEAQSIAAYLETELPEFTKWFARQVDDRLCLVDGEGESCVFLEGNKCLVYPVRPQQCRTYPFWPENMRTEDSWALTQQDCPGLGNGEPHSDKEIIRVCRGKGLDSTR